MSLTWTSVIMNMQCSKLRVSDGAALFHPEDRNVAEATITGGVGEGLCGRYASLLTGEEDSVERSALNSHVYLKRKTKK